MKALIFIDPGEKGAAMLTVKRLADNEITSQQVLQPGEELAVDFQDEPIYIHLENVVEGPTDPAPVQALRGM